MKIGLLGDVHGRVFHALSVLIQWQLRAGTELDRVIQVGDLGAWPEPRRADAATLRYAALDPGEFDFRRLLDAEKGRADELGDVRRHLPGPIWFIRGNHDDSPWLAELTAGATRPVPADPAGLYHCVPDGLVLREQHVTIAFLGGVETDPASPSSPHEDAWAELCRRRPGQTDLLITHEGPLGLATSRRGEVRGSRRISKLVKALRPKYHLFGHHHQMVGPTRAGRTTHIGLNQLVVGGRDTSQQVVQPGSLGVLDTSLGAFNFVTDGWLADFDRALDLGDIRRQLIPPRSDGRQGR